MNRGTDQVSTFKQILVPLDASESAKKAADFAIGLAKSHGARLTLFHVIVTPAAVMTADSMAPYSNLSQYWADARKEAESFMTAIASKARDNKVEVDMKIVDNISSAVQAIVDEAEKRNADLIVMGTRGMGGFKRMLLGSVSSGVVGHAHCSVLVVR